MSTVRVEPTASAKLSASGEKGGPKSEGKVVVPMAREVRSHGTGGGRQVGG